MKRVFKVAQMFEVPDGTKVCPFLNPLDSNEKELSPQLLAGMSIAAGEIAPGVRSKVHLHPVISQVTWVIKGSLRVMMKGAQDAAPYDVDLEASSAVLTEAQTFFQLINPSDTTTVSVLYLVSPAYIFEMDCGKVIYDDAVTFNENWRQLAERNWKPGGLVSLPEVELRRREAITRITNRKRS